MYPMYEAFPHFENHEIQNNHITFAWYKKDGLSGRGMLETNNIQYVNTHTFHEAGDIIPQVLTLDLYSAMWVAIRGIRKHPDHLCLSGESGKTRDRGANSIPSDCRPRRLLLLSTPRLGGDIRQGTSDLLQGCRQGRTIKPLPHPGGLVYA